MVLESLIENYRPSPSVLRALKNLDLVATVGATASGKSSVMEAAINSTLEPPMQIVLSDVSRPPRGDEVDAVDYNFKSKFEMIEGLKNGAYVQVALNTSGDIYATRPDSYPPDGIGTMAVLSHVIKEFRSLPFKKMSTAFIVPYSFKIWEEWLTSQALSSNWTYQQFQTRLKEAKKSYQFALSDKKTSFILNDRLKDAAARLKQVAKGKIPGSETKARNTAHLNLKLLAQKLETGR